MRWWALLGWFAVVVGVTGFVAGLRTSRHNDELGRGMLIWAGLAWVGVAVLVGTEVT
ncbi:hypothetical protein [Pedococcus bigeumensis]|uniref:hypothetical protein n=1 Tax=Pedococcus bigeumensis TaxID=433644 RepID=UPI002FEAF19F